jgi:nitrate/nitrite transport system permease protein
MNMPAKKIESAAVLANAPAAVVKLMPNRLPVTEKYVKMVRETAVRVVPPLIVLALLMLFW